MDFGDVLWAFLAAPPRWGVNRCTRCCWCAWMLLLKLGMPLLGDAAGAGECCGKSDEAAAGAGPERLFDLRRSLDWPAAHGCARGRTRGQSRAVHCPQAAIAACLAKAFHSGKQPAHALFRLNRFSSADREYGWNGSAPTLQAADTFGRLASTSRTAPVSLDYPRRDRAAQTDTGRSCSIPATGRCESGSIDPLGRPPVIPGFLAPQCVAPGQTTPLRGVVTSVEVQRDPITSSSSIAVGDAGKLGNVAAP